MADPVVPSRLATLTLHLQQQQQQQQSQPATAACRPCCAASAAPTADTEPPMSVFVLIGQSNMAGRGELPPGSASLDPPSDVFCFGYDDDAWQPATQPLHYDPPIVASLTAAGGSSGDPLETLESGGAKGAGIGWAFARKLIDDKLVDGTIGLVPCAFGGSPLSRWVRQPRPTASSGETSTESTGGDAQGTGVPVDMYKGRARELMNNPGVPGDLYERAWRRTKEERFLLNVHTKRWICTELDGLYTPVSLQALASHPNAVLRGFLWHQGESDTTTAELAGSVSNFAFKMMNFVFKMMSFVLIRMNFGRWQPGLPS